MLDQSLSQELPPIPFYAPHDPQTVRPPTVPALDLKQARLEAIYDESNAIDYVHIGEPGSSKSFAFSHITLARLLRINHFDVADRGELVLFGLRGCNPALMDGRATSGFVGAVMLHECLPNHVNYRCVLGIWNRQTNKIMLAKGSTVPNWVTMAHQRLYQTDQVAATLLPTGKYPYRIGTNRGVPGTFLLEGETLGLMALERLIYSRTDHWVSGRFSNNIQQGESYGEADPGFRSGGGQTIPGLYENGEHKGPWQQFRRAAGLAGNSPALQNDQKFFYTLFTGREARLVGGMRDYERFTRLRFGSSGPKVLALQDGLLTKGYDPGRLDGCFGAATGRAVVAWQTAQGADGADGIVTPQQAAALGFSLL